MSLFSAFFLSRTAMLGFLAMGALWGSFAALVPVLKAQLGVDDGLFGVLLLGSPLGLLATMWIAPPFDRRLARLSVPVAAATLGGAYLLLGHATTPVLFFLTMVALGLSSGLLDIVVNARVSELEARHNRPLMNANHAMFSVAYGLCAIATGFAREAGFGPAAIFGTLAGLVILSSVFMRMDVTEVTEAERRAVKLPIGIVLLCGGIVLIAFLAEAVVESWSALHIERTLLGNPAEGALGPAVLGLTMALGRLSGQVVAGRVADTTIITYGTALAAVGAIIAALAVTPPMAYLGFGLMGLGTSVVGPLGLALVGRLVPPAQRTNAVARVNVMGFAAFFLAPVVMGQVSDAYGLRSAFFVVAALMLIAPFLARPLRNR